jgi:hypothetical protein
VTDRDEQRLAGLWDHFAVPAILETLRVAELAGIDARSGSVSFYATAHGGAVGSTSLAAVRPLVPAMGD